MKRIVRASFSPYKSNRTVANELLDLEDQLVNLLKFQDLNDETATNLRKAKWYLEQAFVSVQR